jgi:prepilin-type N-terminal cleavage/methylation domain-containing protein
MIMRKLTHRYDNKGFTLVELMIATTVFSTILLLATTGVINIGKLYYKGITTARTQEAARSIADELTRSVQLTDGEIKGFSDEAETYSAVCVGKDRYTYRIDDTKVGDSEESGGQAVRGLWLDEITEGDECEPSSLNNFSAGGRELLGNNMRLIAFSISEQNADKTKYNVSVGVAYGESDLLTTYDDQGNYTGAARGEAQCKSTNSGGSFCAVSSLQTFVKRRFSVVYLN